MASLSGKVLVAVQGAAGESAEPLVVGSRAYGPSGRLLSGTTSMQLARRAACPLLVVPRP